MPDPELVDAIKEIPVTDAHAHYVLNLPPGDPSKLLGAHPFQHPVGLRLDNPQWIEAWQELWGYEYDDMEDEHLKELIVKKNAIIKKNGAKHADRITQKVGIETALVDSVYSPLSPGMKAPRYRMARRVGYLINPFKKNGLAQPPGKNGDPKAASL
jgi:hypothetical protein